jgi:integrase
VHKARQGEAALKLGTHPAPDWLLFPAAADAPTTRIRPRNVSKRFAILAARLGYPGLRFHDLRHTHATLLLTAGVPVNAVQERLGHSTPVITLKVYGHVLQRAEDQAVAVAGSLLAGALA